MTENALRFNEDALYLWKLGFDFGFEVRNRLFDIARGLVIAEIHR